MGLLADNLKLELKPFQVEGVRYLRKNKYAILGDEMGLGKTPQSIALALITKSKALVVCPAYLKFNWAEEIQKFAKNPQKVFVVKTKADIKFNKKEYDFVIVNYELLGKAESLMDGRNLVISDEAHYLKNPKAKRTDAFDKLIYEYCPDRLILATGTPIKNRVGEFYQLMRLCSYDPNKSSTFCDRFPSLYSFQMKFSNMKSFRMRGRTITKFEGTRNVSELKRELDGIYIRRLCKNVLSLEEPIRKDVLVNYSDNPALAAEFDKVSITRGKDSSAKAASALSKTPYTAKYCKGLFEEGSGQLVIFTDHVESARDLGRMLDIEAIDGSTPMAKRDKIVKAFQSGKTNFIVGTIGAMSTGLNLIQSCHVIFNDISWVSGDNDQAEKRIHRFGQTNVCTFHRILGSFQDAYISKKVVSKANDIKEVV